MGTYANDRALPAAHDPLLDGLTTRVELQASDMQYLFRDGLVRMEVAPPRRGEYPGETLIEGAGAAARWVALYDRASTLRATVRPGDGVGTRQAQRAIRSLFLYEHQLAAKTRRQARTSLWRRERAEPLPAFAERSRWSRCRCPECQSAAHPVGIAELVLRSA